MAIRKQIAELLGLKSQPVAVKFQSSAPADVPRIDSAAVSGCTYWKYAAEGRTFYTEAADHYGCPIGVERATLGRVFPIGATRHSGRVDARHARWCRALKRHRDRL